MSPFSNKSIQIEEDSGIQEYQENNDELNDLLSAEEELKHIFNRRYTPKKAMIRVLALDETSARTKGEVPDLLENYLKPHAQYSGC